jgi:CRISPR-associated protein Cas1
MCRIIDLINEDSVSADIVLARKIVENNLVAVYHFWVLSIPILDVVINGRRSPLMIAVGTTTASLFKCYSGEVRKITYPTM